MTLNELYSEFTKENIKIYKINLENDLKGGYLCDNNKKYIVFINKNIKDETVLKYFLIRMLNHIKYNNNS